MEKPVSLQAFDGVFYNFLVAVRVQRRGMFILILAAEPFACFPRTSATSSLPNRHDVVKFKFDSKRISIGTIPSCTLAHSYRVLDHQGLMKSSCFYVYDTILLFVSLIS